jgi:hypothetical protein
MVCIHSLRRVGRTGAAWFAETFAVATCNAEHPTYALGMNMCGHFAAALVKQLGLTLPAKPQGATQSNTL